MTSRLGICAAIAFIVLGSAAVGIPPALLGATYVVPDNCPTIQGCIDAAANGDTIFVRAGTYYEHIVVDKSLTLRGEDKNTTVIDGSGSSIPLPCPGQDYSVGVTVGFTADSVSMSGFTIRNSGGGDCYLCFAVGLLSSVSWLTGCLVRDNQLWGVGVVGNGNTVSGNSLTSNPGYGIEILGSRDNLIANNSVGNCGRNIVVTLASTNNTITENVSQNSRDGVTIMASEASGNRITNNWVLNCYYGIAVGSSDNVICGNNIIQSTMWGLGIHGNNNRIYHNNLILNAQQAYAGDAGYQWDAGYPSGGNYWSDYDGEDRFSGPNQNVPGSDGIGDTPYIIDSNNIDRYPLMSNSGPSKTEPATWGAVKARYR